MFQGLRQGNIIYVIDKGNLTLTLAEVEKVSNPYTLLQKQQGNKMQMLPAYMQPPGQEQFVDVVAKSADHVLNLEELPANQSYCVKNNLFVCDNTEMTNTEIDNSERSSKVIIESVPYHEKAIKSYKEMKLLINPQFAKEKEQEEKITELQGKMEGIETTLGNMMTMLSDALGHNKYPTPKKIKED